MRFRKQQVKRLKKGRDRINFLFLLIAAPLRELGALGMIFLLRGRNRGLYSPRLGSPRLGSFAPRIVAPANKKIDGAILRAGASLWRRLFHNIRLFVA